MSHCPLPSQRVSGHRHPRRRRMCRKGTFANRPSCWDIDDGFRIVTDPALTSLTAGTMRKMAAKRTGLDVKQDA